MQRREFIGLIGGATAWPLAARAQLSTMPVVGFLGTGSSESDAFRVAAVRRGLTEAGYVEGRNVKFEYRLAEGHYERLPALATELVHREVAVIVAIGGITSAVAAKSATITIPIVFVIGGDPVGLGLVASLNRPGGNITGVSFLVSTLAAKAFEVLHETVPQAALIGYLVNPSNADANINTKNVMAAAESIGQKLLVVQASTDSELGRPLPHWPNSVPAHLWSALNLSSSAGATNSLKSQHVRNCPRSILYGSLRRLAV
jgi:putative ABC transport system substrate-binding protein